MMFIGLWDIWLSIKESLASISIKVSVEPHLWRMYEMSPPNASGGQGGPGLLNFDNKLHLRQPCPYLWHSILYSNYFHLFQKLVMQLV